jgi:hypothetical protein
MREIALIFLLLFQSCTVIYRVDYDEIKALELKIKDELRKRIEVGFPTRPDGFCYAIDLAEIMSAAVETEDSLLFARAYEILKKHYIIRDSWIDSTILWRYNPGGTIDASGTAETIHCAYSIFLAYKKWKNEEYKRVSYSLAKAYIKHGFMLDSNRFLVKNYFNYQTRTLSENTWMINQRPDVLKMIGEENGDLDMINKANMMYNAIIRAYVKDGFFHSLYDIGVRTVIPTSLGYYSPDGIFPLISSIDIGISIFQFNEKPSKQILEFIYSNFGKWSDYYTLSNGEFIASNHFSGFALVTFSKIVDIYFLLKKPPRYRTLVQYIVGDILPEKINSMLNSGPEKIDSFYFELAITLRTLNRLEGDEI